MAHLGNLNVPNLDKASVNVVNNKIEHEKFGRKHRAKFHVKMEGHVKSMEVTMGADSENELIEKVSKFLEI